MAYSNTTDFLKLPQWIGADHPTFASNNGKQGDFNTAFSLIDANAKSQSQTLETTTQTANNASGQAANAISLANALSPRVDTLEDDLQATQTTLSNSSLDASSALANSKQNAKDIAKLQEDLKATTSTANSASSTASTANSTANTAKSTATTANTNANKALTTANANATSISDLQDTISDLQTSLTSLQTKVNSITSMTDANFKTKTLNILYPVGSVYLTVGTTSPQALIGGTWTKISSNKYLKTTSSGANTTGGNTSVSFKITERQTPWKQCGEEAQGFGLTNANVQNSGNAAFGFANRVSVARGDVANQNSVSFNLDPSYITVIAWRRTA